MGNSQAYSLKINRMPITLIAVSGMSPAILTETLWALANEEITIVPDEVIVITTSKGKVDIESQLLSGRESWAGASVWETLRQDIFKLAKIPRTNGMLQLSIRLIDLPDATTGIRQPAGDIRTGAHNKEMANFIINTVAPFADAEDQHLIASIAGGRKTMGALLYAAMSLLGKETDRVTHVLVSDPFDRVPGFYYPAQPEKTLMVPAGAEAAASIRAQDAIIDLADIPFVPLRNKFAELKERLSFAGLVEAYSKADRPLSRFPVVKFDNSQTLLIVQNKEIKLTGRVLLVTAFLFERAKMGLPHHNDALDAEQDYEIFFNRWKTEKRHERLLAKSYNGRPPAAQDITKALYELRGKMTKAGVAAAIPYLAPERSRIGFDIRPG